VAGGGPIGPGVPEKDQGREEIDVHAFVAWVNAEVAAFLEAWRILNAHDPLAYQDRMTFQTWVAAYLVWREDLRKVPP
jgi:hypothetical protein